MSDFTNLAPVIQTSVQVKLDGFIEACVHTARAHGIGLEEALDLAIRALLREMAAHKFDPARAGQLWHAATRDVLPAAPPVQGIIN